MFFFFGLLFLCTFFALFLHSLFAPFAQPVTCRCPCLSAATWSRPVYRMSWLRVSPVKVLPLLMIRLLHRVPPGDPTPDTPIEGAPDGGRILMRPGAWPQLDIASAIVPHMVPSIPSATALVIAPATAPAIVRHSPGHSPGHSCVPGTGHSPI